MRILRNVTTKSETNTGNASAMGRKTYRQVALELVETDLLGRVGKDCKVASGAYTDDGRIFYVRAGAYSGGLRTLRQMDYVIDAKRKKIKKFRYVYD